MDSIRIIRVYVTKTPTKNVWYKVGEIYEVKSETRPLKRSNGQILQAYYLVNTKHNEKMHGKACHDGMCIGTDCCVVLGSTNSEYKSLLSKEY